MAKNYRILVVDDEPDVEPMVRQRMRREIRKKVYDFVFACNGIDALEKIQAAGNIDIVLTDINMPKMDGPRPASGIAGYRPKHKKPWLCPPMVT